MSIQTSYLSPGAKPIFKRGNDIGCLCIHGFAAAPTEIGWLGDHLHHTLGMTVYTPRLAGHGTNPQDMRRMLWQDWYYTVRDGYEILRSQCEQVFVSGISMGGLLTLMLAADDEVDFSAAAVIATPTHFNSENLTYAQYLKFLYPIMSFPDRTLLPQVIREEQYSRGEQVVGRTHYDRWALSAVSELYSLAKIVRENLHKITVPMVLIYAEKDGAVPLSCSDYIVQHSRSTHTEQHVLHKSGHIITQDVERETAFKLVEKFFSQYLEISE